jgi:hypothetical protein
MAKYFVPDVFLASMTKSTNAIACSNAAMQAAFRNEPAALRTRLPPMTAT